MKPAQGIVDGAAAVKSRASFAAASRDRSRVLSTTNHNATTSLIELRLTHLASHRVGHRPNRIEPRAINRRGKAYDWLTQPRIVARGKLLAGCSS